MALELRQVAWPDPVLAGHENPPQLSHEHLFVSTAGSSFPYPASCSRLFPFALWASFALPSRYAPQLGRTRRVFEGFWRRWSAGRSRGEGLSPDRKNTGGRCGLCRCTPQGRLDAGFRGLLRFLCGSRDRSMPERCLRGLHPRPGAACAMTGGRSRRVAGRLAPSGSRV